MRALLDARKAVTSALQALRWGHSERLVREAHELLDETVDLLNEAIRREAELRRENENLRKQLAAKDRAGARLDPAATKTSGLLALEINKGA